MPPFSFEHLSQLSDVVFDDTCILIADGGLPDAVLEKLPVHLRVEAGEELKTLASIERLAGRVIARQPSRPMTLVAIGGGSVGDAVGFLASVLWRGVGLWHLPTTLLSMVDSAHGGKTAVNISGTKNQLGTFYPAQRTIIVDELLETLPAARRREGLSEILKALAISDPAALAALSPGEIEALAFAPFNEIRSALVRLIDNAIRIKLDLVRQDPDERRGIRTVLNLGHTIAHALELTAQMPHGHAVAWGLASVAELSRDFGCDDRTRSDFIARLYPLLDPFDMPDRVMLRDAISHDKKRAHGALRSVVLQAPGRPVITDAIGSDDWITALERVSRWFRSATVTASLDNARRVSLSVEASKSEINRALVIAAQRQGRTSVLGCSTADDVRRLVNGLQALGFAIEQTRTGYAVDQTDRGIDPDAPRHFTVHCGDGAAPFRFLLALASTRRHVTTLYASPALLSRPHEPLIHALRQGGATIERVDDVHGSGYRVQGWRSMPAQFSVDCSTSSQFASAIAMLAAGAEAPFTLRLLGSVVSRSYFDMTLAMLVESGVEYLEHNDLYAFNPTARLRESVILRAEPDASAQAVWKVAQFFDHPLLLEQSSHNHPDAVIDRMLQSIYEGQRLDEIVLECTRCPDLVPVLAVAALRSSTPVRLTGVAHARHKESNRIDDLAAALAAVGITVLAKPDGLVIPPRAALTLRTTSFDPRGDHRLAMAGFLLSMLAGEIALVDPWCVTKSYPSFWNDARLAGWSVLPQHSDYRT